MPRTSPARPPRPRTRPTRTRTRKRTTRARNATAAAPNPKPTAANATDHNCAADVAAALARANALRTTLRRPGLKRGIGPGRAPTAPTRWRHTPRSPRRQPAPTTSAHAHQTPAAHPPPAPRPPDPQPDHEVRRHPHGSDYAPRPTRTRLEQSRRAGSQTLVRLFDGGGGSHTQGLRSGVAMTE